MRVGLGELPDKAAVRPLIAVEQHRRVRGDRALRPRVDEQREDGPIDMIEQKFGVLDCEVGGRVDHVRPHCSRAGGGQPDQRYAAACSAVIWSPATVVRRMSRACVSSKSRARCIVTRLSHITRSLTRHSCA
jgi:hypothetical protein